MAIIRRQPQYRIEPKRISEDLARARAKRLGIYWIDDPVKRARFIRDNYSRC